VPKKPKPRWGNPASKPTYGHSFTNGGHGRLRSYKSLWERAKRKGFQIGQWKDEVGAAKLIGDEVAKQAPGTKSFDIDLPEGMGHVVMPDGKIVPADKGRVFMNPDGTVDVSFPFNSGHPTGQP
jgi:hypothetical protein